MFYLLTFAVSLLLMCLSGYCRGALKLLLLAVSLLLPCLVAGFRDISIGTDTSAYAIWTFESASRNGLRPFLESYASLSAAGFNLFSWVIANWSCSFGIYLGAIELAFLLPVFIAIRHYFPNREWPGMAVVYLLMFTGSMNLMKQSIAIGFVFLSSVFADEKRPIPFLLCIAMGILFHQTAVIGLLVYPLFLTVARPLQLNGASKWRSLILVTIALIAISLVFVFGKRLIATFSFLKDSYQYQVGHVGEGGLQVSYLVLAVLLFVSWWTCRPFDVDGQNSVSSVGYLSREHARYDSFFALSLLGCALMQLDVVSLSLGRFGYYLVPFVGLFLAKLYVEGNRMSRMVSVLLLICLVVFFVRAFIILGGNQVYPYITSGGVVLP